MPFRPARLAFLPSLLLFQFVGNVQAIPVRNDDTEIEARIETVAEWNEVFGPAAQAIQGPSPSASLRTAAENTAGASARPAASRIGEATAVEGYPSLTHGSGVTRNEPDPLARTFRSIVNVKRRQDASGSFSYAPRDEEQWEIDPGDEGRAVIREARELLADAIRSALDPHADEDGRITFSIAGIEGFHLLADGDLWSLGLGDTVLATVQRHARDGENGAYPAIRRAGYLADGYPRDKHRLREQDEAAFDPIALALAFAIEAIQHPLTWLFITIYVTYKIAAAIGSGRFATRRRPARQKRASAA